MDAPNEYPHSDLTELINQDLDGYQHLSDILDQEKQLLVQRHFDELTAILGTKHDLLTRLGTIANLRTTLMEQLGAPANDEGMQQLIDGLPDGEADSTRNHWQTLMKLVQTCNRKNEVNAKITHRAQATNRQILNILRGENGREDLYGKNGKGGGNRTPGTIASA